MSDFNATQFLANQLRAAADELAELVDDLPTDRMDWRPMVNGHASASALDATLEAAAMLSWGAQAFRERHASPIDDAAMRAQRQARRSDATMWLIESAGSLSAAVAGFPESVLSQMITNPVTGEPTSWAEFALFFFGVVVQREGQVRSIRCYNGLPDTHKA